MTEEIIKECKNCDALGIDSEIGVYYCCLSHRQDDLPKEFTCNDFTPNKQLKRLEQENEELKTWLESKEKQLKHLIEYNRNKKDQIKTLKFMLFDEKEIPKDKFTMMYRIAQNERRTRSHRDLCTNITKNYRSALEEIKNSVINYLPKENYKFARSFNPAEFELLENILTKINEVLE